MYVCVCMSVLNKSKKKFYANGTDSLRGGKSPDLAHTRPARCRDIDMSPTSLPELSDACKQSRQCMCMCVCLYACSIKYNER